MKVTVSVKGRRGYVEVAGSVRGRRGWGSMEVNLELSLNNEKVFDNVFGFF